jgi:hypothetical protein
VTNSCAPGNEISGSTEDGELVESESDYEPGRKDNGDITHMKQSKLSYLP